jgi:CDP-diacylglycerol--glycerol-3-phosphate 3-phosphatidyltransferase/cardiolipin synthase
MPVSKLAKWKTTFQLVSLGALILGGAIEGPPCAVRYDCGPLAGQWIHLTGLVALWAAAALTLVTGWDYLRVGLKHMD